MMPTFLTLQNPVPAIFGLLTFNVTDASNRTVSLTVPSGGQVEHPVDTTLAPWVITATLSSRDASAQLNAGNFTVTDPNAVLTASLAISEDRAVAITQASPLAASSHSASLTFGMQMQMQTNWSWAAVACSVAAYYKSSTNTQCNLACQVLGRSDCCSPQSAIAVCNRPYSMPLALQAVSHLDTVVPANISMNRIAAEIDAGRPVIAELEWMSGSILHPVVITGYDRVAQTLWLKDSTMGETIVPFSGFPANYHNALAWVRTCFTKA